MTAGVDWAWGRPPVTALRAIGERFAARYLSHDASKNLTRSEAQALSDGGIWIVVVWETTANRAADGYAAGVQDAHDAKDQANACGMPGDRPIYFAVDYDADVADVEPYFRAVGAVLGSTRTGVYGGVRVVKGLLDAGLCTFAWQADAWSYGRWDPRANIRQGGQHTIAGVDCDDDTAMTNVHADYGQWRVGQSPTPQPAQEDDMPQGQLNYGKTKANTTISFPPGKYTKIGFAADNGYAGDKAAELRAAEHLGAGNWRVLPPVVVDSAKDKPVLVLDPKADAISVTYEDDGLVPVGWDMS